MKLLLDTNIVVDVISKREGYSDSLQVMKYCETDHAQGYISVTTVTDVMYILRKHASPDIVRDSVQTLLSILDVADVRKSDIIAAFLSGMKDFEDAVLASCARRIKADYIVTRNFKDFAKSSVPAILPSDILKLLRTI